MHDEHTCSGSCSTCGSACEHSPREQLLATMKFLVSQNTALTRDLANLAKELEDDHVAYQQIMAAVSDYEKGSLRLSMVLASLNIK